MAPRVCPREPGIVAYATDPETALIGPPLRVGDVWHVDPSDRYSLDMATLSLHCNGMLVRGENGRESSVPWSPFTLVQACRLHSSQADAALPWLRLFKVSVFHRGDVYYFAPRTEGAEGERSRWVAAIARSIRLLTRSLYPEFSLHAEPLLSAPWTATRLIAGYLLLCDEKGVSLVYCELHSHWDSAAVFAIYEDEYCDVEVAHILFCADTTLSERIGIDCSCFSFDNYHFATRTSAEKMLWLRVMRNVRVKLRHCAPNPTCAQLAQFRSSILESVPAAEPEEAFTRTELLPRRQADTSLSFRGNIRSVATAAPTHPRLAFSSAGLGNAPGSAQSWREPSPSPPSLQDIKAQAHTRAHAGDSTPPAPHHVTGTAAVGATSGFSEPAQCTAVAVDSSGDVASAPRVRPASSLPSPKDGARARTMPAPRVPSQALLPPDHMRQAAGFTFKGTPLHSQLLPVGVRT